MSHQAATGPVTVCTISIVSTVSVINVKSTLIKVAEGPQFLTLGRHTNDQQLESYIFVIGKVLATS